ncbi:hypothetical protein Amn_pb00270 (plasmid) [Aminobacter sp. Y103A]|uniref:hypothetical protein n=1 Tax=Aminobacter sp. Y103A TaxID=1870862 RepID=UPI002572D945|nr:hypothetical protein [Aminobacter sp. SS-2016]BBD41036.1 hypothetical protein Amn_pb00270 [Aminobacter sp. SS-2016]
MKYREVQETLRTIGIVMSKKDGRIRVNHFGGTPETARFAGCPKEALRLGLSMAQPEQLPPEWCAERRKILDKTSGNGSAVAIS